MTLTINNFKKYSRESLELVLKLLQNDTENLTDLDVNEYERTKLME